MIILSCIGRRAPEQETVDCFEPCTNLGILGGYHRHHGSHRTPPNGFSRLDYSLMKRVPTRGSMFLDNSRRDRPDATVFGAGTPLR